MRRLSCSDRAGFAEQVCVSPLRGLRKCPGEPRESPGSDRENPGVTVSFRVFVSRKRRVRSLVSLPKLQCSVQMQFGPGGGFKFDRFIPNKNINTTSLKFPGMALSEDVRFKRSRD